MHIKVPGKLLNGGATATALYNYTTNAQLNFDRTLGSIDDYELLEHKNSYYKFKLTNQSFSKIITNYPGLINGWINLKTGNSNAYLGYIIKITFDDKTQCDNYINNILKSSKAKAWGNKTLSLSGVTGGYYECKYIRTNDNIIYISQNTKIGKIDDNAIGGCWYQFDTVGASEFTGTLEIEFYDPFFNDPDLCGFYKAPNVQEASKYWIKLFKKLKSVSTTQTIYVGDNILSLLTDEDKKIATDKGWTLA